MGIKGRISKSSPQPTSLLHLDHIASHSLYKAGTRVPRPIWKLFEYSGDGIVWLFITISIILAPATPSYWRYIFTNFLLGLLIDLAEVGLLKGLVRRPRPEHNTIAKDMVVVVAVDHYSFPSGHSSRVSFIALFISILAQSSIHLTTLTKDPSVIVIVACTWALTVAISRCIMGRHYLTDVIAGLIVGVFTISILTKATLREDGFLVDAALTDYMYDKYIRRFLKA